MWVISVNYPVFLALIFLECFFSKKRYLFRDVATNWAPLYYCVRWYLNTEGQPTVRRTTCRLLRLFSATDCEASQYKDSISFVCTSRAQENCTGLGNADKDLAKSSQESNLKVGGLPPSLLLILTQLKIKDTFSEDLGMTKG